MKRRLLQLFRDDFGHFFTGGHIGQVRVRFKLFKELQQRWHYQNSDPTVVRATVTARRRGYPGWLKESNDMPEELPKIDDPEILAEKIGEILISGSLYRKFEYIGTQCHFTKPHPAVGSPRYGALPRLRMFCNRSECNMRTWWDVNYFCRQTYSAKFSPR
jgi:hypothetical protein